MFCLISCFLSSTNKNIENVFKWKCIFRFYHIFILSKIKFFISTENIENEIVLFSIFYLFRKIFLLKMKIKIHFLWSIKIKTENKQIKHSVKNWIRTVSYVFELEKNNLVYVYIFMLIWLSSQHVWIIN